MQDFKEKPCVYVAPHRRYQNRSSENVAPHFSMDLDAEQNSSSEELDENPSSSVKYPQLDLAAVVSADAKESCENNSSNAENTSSEDVELPSNVTDRRQIFMPMDIKRDDPRIYGKWLWFSNGDLYLQDQIWIQLANLILQGLVILQESSTVKSRCDSKQGVIMCYTRGDVDAIKKAGLAIQSIVNDGVILHYKSNKASADKQNRTFGDRFISEYMITACGELYTKDYLSRWKKVKEVVESKLPKCAEPGLIDPYRSSPLSDFDVMPSNEYTKVRYFYPVNSEVQQFDGCWCFFCDIDDFDRYGCSEVDRLWMVAKSLVDDGVLSMASCETRAAAIYPSYNTSRRSVQCVVKSYNDFRRLVWPVDRLRKEIVYSFPVYFKVCHLFRGEKRFKQKYLYSDDRELYEYVNECWQLVAKADDLNENS